MQEIKDGGNATHENTPGQQTERDYCNLHTSSIVKNKRRIQIRGDHDSLQF